MIQVPSVEIAGFETGSVWFTAKPNSNFNEYMSQWTDVKVEGVLGGLYLNIFLLLLIIHNQGHFLKNSSSTEWGQN